MVFNVSLVCQRNKEIAEIVQKKSPSVQLNSIVEPQSFAQKKIIEACGFPVLNSDGKSRDDFWSKIWTRVIKLRGKQYRLPGGALGREFTSKYASVINSLAQGYQNSEASVCFVPLILQKE